MNKIVAVVGMSGTGKSEVVKEFQTLHPFEYVYFGGAVVDEVKARGLEVTEANEAAVREDLRANHGMAAIAVLKLPAIEKALREGKDVLIDGLYSQAEYQLLSEKFDDALLLVAVHSNKDLRTLRLSSRPVRPLTPEEIKVRDFREIVYVDKGGPIATADYHILNNGSMDELKKQTRMYFESIFSSVI